ncbi:MAG TPA: hypothetical protein VGK58_05830 [Lacipirellulaceae bacterium]
MAEHRESARFHGLQRRVVDWPAVAGMVLEWLLAIGELAFGVLLFGLVGGYFGQFLDFGLYLIGVDWAGRGREWGWILGAAAAAIGMPLGWARVDGKRFSLPSPRKLRKTISAGARRRRTKKKETYEFRNAGDVLKGGGLSGLFGAILGFFLGGALFMCWFSLAMSPLAPADWSGSLEVKARPHIERRPRREHERGPVITSDHPLPMYLWFTPVLAFGALGAAAGTIYGAAEYFRYVANVPATIREQQRHAQRAPKVTQAEATAAAIEQELPVLAPAPRPVPLRAQWQLLRRGSGIGLVLGVACSIVGVVFLLASVLDRPNSTEEFFVFILLTTVFLIVGALATAASAHHWRRQVAILRRGYLAKCSIEKCKDLQSGKWKPYQTLLAELRAAWDTPLSACNTKADTKRFQRFARVFKVFAVIVFAFMGIGGVIVSGGVIYVAVVEHDPLAIFGVFFIAAWWALVVWMARSFLRVLRPLTNVGSQTLKSLGIQPIVECRAVYSLPQGKTIELKTKIDLSRRLAPGSGEPDDVAVYDPLQPSRALLLSSFDPPLEIGQGGRWQVARR